MRLVLLVALAVSGSGAVRRVLVTGANKGIGRAICKRILVDYPDVHVLLGSRSVARGKSAVEGIIVEVPEAEGRLELLPLDVTDEGSVEAAAASVKVKYEAETTPLYAICNNAGIGFGRSIRDTLETNFYGSERVAEHFLPLLDPKCGRVCNIASASGPNYVCALAEPQKTLFTSRQTTREQLEAELQRAAALTDYEGVAYGLSKAAVNLWTMILAAEHPHLRINSCSPGYILTDLTAGMGATKRPEQSNCHVAPLFLLFGDPPFPEGNGRYYGSDAVRSPIDRYRGPGDPPYCGD